MEEFQKHFFQTTVHRHFSARNANILPIFQIDRETMDRFCRILRVKSCFSQKPSHKQPNFSYHGIMNNKQLLGLCLISESSMSQKRERSQYTIKGCFAKFIFLIMSRLSQYVAYYLQLIIAFHRANPNFCSTKYYYKHSGPKG